MARIATTESLIYQRILARIIAEVSEATESTCYLSLDPDHIATPNPGDFVYVVTPMTAGQLDGGIYGGAGDAVVVEDANFAVTVHSISQLDESGRDAEFLNDATLGILARKRQVLAALIEHDLLDASGNEILVQPIEPTGTDKRRPDRSSGSVQIVFKIRFEHDLTT